MATHGQRVSTKKNLKENQIMKFLANSLGFELSDFSDDQADLDDLRDMLEGGI